jgi:hypothetical protein
MYFIVHVVHVAAIFPNFRSDMENTTLDDTTKNLGIYAAIGSGGAIFQVKICEAKFHSKTGKNVFKI